MVTLNQFEEFDQGMLLAGNYRGSIAVSDYVKNTCEIAEDVSSEILSTR
ncbi:MAG: hypothetical protein ABSC53_00510 [Bacteroidota bacterium]|jgi:hypothetical protein